MHRTRSAPIATAFAAAALLMLAGCSTGASHAPADQGDSGTRSTTSSTSAAAKPTILDTSKLDACTLLSQAEAETLASAKLVTGVTVSTSDVASCTYAGDPSGPTAQVELYVGTGAKQQLSIDRDELKHAFTQPTGLGDEAWQEDGMIWARKGSTWVSIRLVRLEDAAQFVQPLQTAMSTVLGRLT